MLARKSVPHEPTMHRPSPIQDTIDGGGQQSEARTVLAVRPYRSGRRIQPERGGVSPVETHVFPNSDEPDEIMQTLLSIAENTCYLRAALRSALP